MTEILVSRHTAEQLLEREIEKAVALAQNGMQSQSENDYDRWIQDFEGWRRMASAVVAKIYGRSSSEQKDFENTGRLLVVGGGTPWNVEQRRAVERLESRNNVLRSLVEQLELVDEPSGVALSAQRAQEPDTPMPMGIFIVHGQNEAIREAVARTLEKAGREVVILHEQANKGRTLIEKFEQHAATAGSAVILLTADDVGGPEGKDLRPRARQNVVFEMGFFYGRLGRERVAVLYEPTVEKPSDIDGIVYIPLDQAGAWKTALLAEFPPE
jgi:predicted nucleotide-binding protein